MAITGRVSIMVIIATAFVTPTIIATFITTVPFLTAARGVAVSTTAVSTTTSTTATTAATRATCVVVTVFTAVVVAVFTATAVVAAVAVRVVAAVTVFVTTTAEVATTTIPATAVIVAVATATTASTELTLGRAEVFAGSGGSGTATTSLLNAQSAAFDNLTLQTLLGSISLLSSNHLDETETTRFLGVGVNHDGAVLNITVFLKKTGDVGFSQTGVDASDEEVGAGILGALLIVEGLAGIRRGTIIGATIRGTAAGAISSRLITGRGAAIAGESRLVVVTTAVVVVFSRHIECLEEG
jgi:hypothetical protein